MPRLALGGAVAIGIALLAVWVLGDRTLPAAERSARSESPAPERDWASASGSSQAPRAEAAPSAERPSIAEPLTLGPPERLPSESETAQQTRHRLRESVQSYFDEAGLDQSQQQSFLALIREAHDNWEDAWKWVEASHNGQIVSDYIEQTSEWFFARAGRFLDDEQFRLMEIRIAMPGVLGMPDGLVQPQE